MSNLVATTRTQWKNTLYASSSHDGWSSNNGGMCRKGISMSNLVATTRTQWKYTLYASRSRNNGCKPYPVSRVRWPCQLNKHAFKVTWCKSAYAYMYCSIVFASWCQCAYLVRVCLPVSFDPHVSTTLTVLSAFRYGFSPFSYFVAMDHRCAQQIDTHADLDSGCNGFSSFPFPLSFLPCPFEIGPHCD